MANPANKTRPKNNPYESWEVPGVGIYHVLKKYRAPAQEAADPYARWLTYCENEYGDMGDMYASEIKRSGFLVYRDPTLTEF